MYWEQIDRSNQRARVYKGWVVKTLHYTQISAEAETSKYKVLMSTTFVPDPNHSWRL